MAVASKKKDNNKESSAIYISIDHLKDGIYQLHILYENEIIKSVKFRK